MKKIILGLMILITANVYAQTPQPVSTYPTATGRGEGSFLYAIQGGISKKLLIDSINQTAKKYADSINALVNAQAIANAAAILQRGDSLRNNVGVLEMRKNNVFVPQFTFPVSPIIDSQYLRRDINNNTTNISANTTAINTKQNLVSLTTVGSGAATFTPSTGALNIPISSGGGGSGGLDSGAYRNTISINDTTFALVKANGTKDTIAFSLSTQKINAIAGNNVTITGTYPNLTFNSQAGSTGWDLGGNSINPLFDYFGTNSNHSIRFKTNNILRATLDSFGRFAIGGNALSDGELFEVKSGNARIQNILKFADGSGFTIQDRLIRSYGALEFFDISQGQDAFSAGGTGFLAGPNVTNFTTIPNRLQMIKSGNLVSIIASQYDYGGGEDFKIIVPSYAFGGNASSVMGNMYLSVGKSTTTNVYGKIILGHDGTAPTSNILVGTTTDNGNKMQVNGTTYMSNQSTPSTPTGGGVIFVQGGALKYIGSSGTVTTLANP